jgi:hypothetical protein
MEKTCEKCGEKFEVPTWLGRRRKFCGRKCAELAKRKGEGLVTCLVCGVEFSVYDKKGSRTDYKYCSKHCSGIASNLERGRESYERQRESLKKTHASHGGHGIGKTKRGLLDHACARSYVLRDPFGKVHRVQNLCEWVRRNISKFKDEFPESKAPFPLRVAMGLSSVATGHSGSYKGWVAVSKSEYEADPRTPDLLGRNPIQPNTEGLAISAEGELQKQI